MVGTESQPTQGAADNAIIDRPLLNRFPSDLFLPAFSHQPVGDSPVWVAAVAGGGELPSAAGVASPAAGGPASNVTLEPPSFSLSTGL